MKNRKELFIGCLATLMISFLFAACQSSSVEPENAELTTEQVEAVVSKITVKNVIDISWENENLSYQIKDGFVDGFTTSEPGDEVCRGSGISFARCVRDVLDDGKTLKLYKDGDEYVAEEIEQPEVAP